MAPIVSTLPAAKSYVVGKIRALAGFQPTAPNGVAVSYGHPGKLLEREHVWIGGTTIQHEWGPLGRYSKNETYQLKGFVLVDDPGGTQQAVTERAFAIFGPIELAFRTAAEISLGGIQGVIDVNVRPTGLFEGVLDEGRQALIEFDLDVNARI